MELKIAIIEAMEETRRMVENQIAKHGSYGGIESWEEYVKNLTVNELLYILTGGEIGDVY